jgi:D-alanyl-D-alanine carboxypeptidase
MRALPATSRAAIEAAIRHELAAYGGKQPVPGAIVGVWVPGQGDFVQAIGLSNLNPPTPMRLTDTVRIGSNTKTFLVTVLLQLVDEKRLELDAPLSAFNLGFALPPESGLITVRQLMAMRSGIPDLYNLPDVEKAVDADATGHFEMRRWIDLALHKPLLFKPGSRYDYSNTNYLLLGMILTNVTRHGPAEAIAHRLIGPLKLWRTSFPGDSLTLPPPFAHGYGLTAEGWADQTSSLSPTVTWAAGAMISDLADMKRWVEDYVSGKLNSPATQRERLACQPTGKQGTGFGLGIACSNGWFGYTGGVPSYNTAAYYNPVRHATIVVLVNAQREHSGQPDVASMIVHDIGQIITPDAVPFQP